MNDLWRTAVALNAKTPHKHRFTPISIVPRCGRGPRNNFHLLLILFLVFFFIFFSFHSRLNEFIVLTENNINSPIYSSSTSAANVLAE